MSIAVQGHQEPGLLQKIIRRRESTAAGILILMVVAVCAIRRDGLFIHSDNLFLLCRQISLTAIVAMGVFFVILTSGIDLSVGSIVGISGYTFGLMVERGNSIPVSLMCAVGAAVAVGAANGVVVAFLRVTPFIVTLGMLWVGRSIVYNLKNSDSVNVGSTSPHPAPLFCSMMAQGDFLGIPSPVIVLSIGACLAHICLKYTVFGRRIYALGGNEEATELSGINTHLVKFFTYVVSAFFCCIGGLVYIGRSGSASASLGDGMELQAIAACVIGGTSLMGGQGTVLGVLLGAAIMGVLDKGLVMTQEFTGIASSWDKGIVGTTIIIAAIVDAYRTRKGI